jgi:superfamily II DNA/RNA helicase
VAELLPSSLGRHRSAEHARIVRKLRTEGVPTAVLHGVLTQSVRQRAVVQFREGRVRLLVATDIAAGGLDVDGVDLVIHYDPPEDHKAYLHRSGRTARAGEGGVAVSLLLWNQVVEAERLCLRLWIRPAAGRDVLQRPRLANLTSDAWTATEPATGTEGAPRPARTGAGRLRGGGGRRRRCTVSPQAPPAVKVSQSTTPDAERPSRR